MCPFAFCFNHLPPRPCIVLKPRPMFMLPPRPRPLPAPGPLVPARRPAASACCYSLLGLRMVWSTERMVTAASVAAVNTLSLTISGSHTNNSIRSSTLPPRTLTPYQRPFSPSTVCTCLSLFKTSVPSMPELSASCLGMISRALA